MGIRDVSLLCQLSFFFLPVALWSLWSAVWRIYLGMSTGKATAPPAAEMPSTMDVRARMFPCSGESAALRRSAKRSTVTRSVSEQGYLFVLPYETCV